MILGSKVNIKTFEQLIKYCYQVAGTVGFMFCKIINVSNQKMNFRRYTTRNCNATYKHK